MARANIARKELPVTAFETAWIMAVLVKMLVDRPKHAAIAKGLRRYAMLKVAPSSPSCFRGEVKSLLETASLELAISARASAFARSIAV